MRPSPMRINTQTRLFAGVRIDGRMREQLDKCPPRDRVYFDSPDHQHLTVLRGSPVPGGTAPPGGASPYGAGPDSYGDGRTAEGRGEEPAYIGKLLDPAMPLSGLDDIRRNVRSILMRICPGRLDESAIKLFAVASGTGTGTGVIDDEPGFTPPRRSSTGGDPYSAYSYGQAPGPIGSGRLPADAGRGAAGDRDRDRDRDYGSPRVGTPERRGDLGFGPGPGPAQGYRPRDPGAGPGAAPGSVKNSTSYGSDDDGDQDDFYK